MHLYYTTSYSPLCLHVLFSYLHCIVRNIIFDRYLIHVERNRKFKIQCMAQNIPVYIYIHIYIYSEDLGH